MLALFTVTTATSSALSSRRKKKFLKSITEIENIVLFKPGDQIDFGTCRRPQKNLEKSDWNFYKGSYFIQAINPMTIVYLPYSSVVDIVNKYGDKFDAVQYAKEHPHLCKIEDYTQKEEVWSIVNNSLIDRQTTERIKPIFDNPDFQSALDQARESVMRQYHKKEDEFDKFDSKLTKQIKS